MPRPKKLTGYTVAGYFAEIAHLMEDAKEVAAQFAQTDRPPASEKEWLQFLTALLRLYNELDQAERTARLGMQIVRSNELLDATEGAEAIDELIERLQALRAGPVPGDDDQFARGR